MNILLLILLTPDSIFLRVYEGVFTFLWKETLLTGLAVAPVRLVRVDREAPLPTPREIRVPPHLIIAGSPLTLAGPVLWLTR